MYVGKRDGTGSEIEPVQLSIRVPQDSAKNIEQFVKSVHDTFTYAIGEAYAPVVIAQDGNDKPKRPQKFHRATAAITFVNSCLEHMPMLGNSEIVAVMQRCQNMLDTLSAAGNSRVRMPEVHEKVEKNRNPEQR